MTLSFRQIMLTTMGLKVTTFLGITQGEKDFSENGRKQLQSS